MQGLFAADGCVIPNRSQTREYEVEFTAKCEHTKIRRAVIVIEGTDEASARSFAERWLFQGSMRGQTVVTSVHAADAWQS